MEMFDLDLDLIEPNLYLGSREAAEDVEILKMHNITHILTVEDVPLWDEITTNANFTTKYIALSDLPGEDLLIHLDDTYAFISESLPKGGVLVHCYVGMSRSASVVIAFMMKKHQLTYEEAFEKVQEKRPAIWPNSGFVGQLRLYQEMGYEVDTKHIDYKLYRLRKVALQVCIQGAVPQHSMGVITPDPELVSKTERKSEQCAYCCSRCSRVLACESNVIPHKYKGEICERSFFVMPVAWMQYVTNAMENELFCPNCGTKVGSFDWSERGVQCECSFTISPAFCLRSPQVKCVLE